MADEKMKKVVSKCQNCGAVEEFEVPDSGLRARSKGTSLITAFPDLPEHRLLQLAYHLCKKCQEAPK